MINEKDLINELVIMAETADNGRDTSALWAADSAFEAFLKNLKREWLDGRQNAWRYQVHKRLCDRGWYDRLNGPEDRDGRYTADELREMKTVHSGHFDNVKIDTGTTRVKLSRLTVADGQPYNDQVTVERLIDGRWVTIEEYEG